MKIRLYDLPKSAADDETFIESRHSLGFLLFLTTLPIAVAVFADTKWVVAAGFAAILVLANAMSRLLDELRIRVRRTNLLLSEKANSK
jgi:hypothetical protein